MVNLLVNTMKTSKLLSFIAISLITFQLLSCKTEKTEKQKQLEAQELENICWKNSRVKVTATLFYHIGNSPQYVNCNVILGHLGEVIDRGYRIKDGCLEVRAGWNNNYILESCADSIRVDYLKLDHIIEKTNDR